jgi:hypothetical protein
VDGLAYLRAVENAACKKERSVTSVEAEPSDFCVGQEFLLLTHCQAV